MPFNAGDIEASLELDRSPFTRGLNEAKAEAKRFEENKIQARISVDRTNLDRLTQSQPKSIKVPVEVESDKLRQQLDRIGDNTEATARRSGNRIARALLNPVVIQLGLLPGIAAASAAASGLALTALVGGFAAIAGVALKGNDQIKQSFKGMWDQVKETTKDATASLAPYGIEVARELTIGFRTVEPQLRGIFQSLGPQVLDLTKGLTSFVTQAMPGFELAIRQSGPSVRGFGQLLSQTGLGLGQFFDQLGKRSAETGRGLNTLGSLLQTLLNNLGRLLGSFAVAWDKVGPSVTRVFDKLLDALNNLTSGGIPAFTGTLNTTLHVLEAVLNVLGPIADIFGGAAGWLLGAVVSWKLLAGSIGLVVKAGAALNPATWSSKLAGFTTNVTNAANSTGGFITKVSGSAQAGERFSGVMTKVGKAVSTSLSYVPLLGAAVAGVTATLDHFFPSADDLATSIARGGKEAEEAKKKIYDVAGGYSKWNVAAGVFGAHMDEVSAALKKHREGLTDVERKQEEAAAATRDYQLAVDKFGKSSPQAVAAQDHLAAATKGVEDAQLAAAKATQTNIDKIIAQTNLILGSVGARLNYQNSLLSLEQAQKEAATATAEHGAKSLESRQANLQYQQSLLSVVQSLGARVKAENADKTESEQNRLATLAMHQEIARLAVIAGKDAPAALQQLAGSLSDAELAALGVHKEVDKTGKAIYTLPPGKSLAFPNDAPVATNQVNTLHSAIDNLPSRKNLNYVISVVTGQNSGTGASSLSGLLGIPGRADGGPVRRGTAYWVGEAGQPELFFPDVDGFILNGKDSQQVSPTSTGSGATPFSPVSTPGGDPQDWVELLVQAFVRALTGTRLRVEGPEWARLVNSANLTNTRR